jgi:hypothetical protein
MSIRRRYEILFILEDSYFIEYEVLEKFESYTIHTFCENILQLLRIMWHVCRVSWSR